LVIRGQDPNDKPKITHKRNLKEVIDEVQGKGLTAYDEMWDGTTEHQKLKSMRKTISGMSIAIADAGTK